MQILTVKEVAAFLKLKEDTVCQLACDGKLPGFKLGKSWRFDMDKVEKWIAGIPRNVAAKPDNPKGE
jgi:excisionase family DNA binding protein